MKKSILLFIYLVSFVVVLQAQKPVSSSNFTGLKIPGYCASGDTTRIPILFQAQLSGLTASAKYKYYVMFIAISDTSNSAATGVGNDLLFRPNGNVVYSKTPGFSAGNHDTLTVDGSGAYTGWFGGLNTNDTRFTAGKYVYPMVVIQEVKSGSPPTQKFYLKDSIKVLLFAANPSGNNGSAIYGNSYTKSKNIVLLYDDTSGTSKRPINITFAESDANSINDNPFFYRNKVDSKLGAWGTIIPNTLPNGIKRIEARTPFAGNAVSYANKEFDATWGNDSTKNQRGGFKPIFIRSDIAPLVAPEIEFSRTQINVNEAATIVKVVVSRKYGNADSSKASISLLTSTATQGSDFKIDTTKRFVFKPYGFATDTVFVTILNDNLGEQTETVNIKLTKLVNAVLGANNTHTTNILDPKKPISSIFFNGLKIPNFCASGDTTRTPLMFQARISGFSPNSKYKYYVTYISISDTSSTSVVGTGSSDLFFKSNGNIGYSATPSFIPGNHDTLTIDIGGEYIGWFGAMTNNDTRFTPGKYIYPMVVLQAVDSLVQPTQKFYLTDSIQVLTYNKAAGSNNGTAIYGNSFAKSKNVVLLYDDVIGSTRRPVSITYLESDGNTIAKMPSFYSTKVNAVASAWGTIIPNTLSNGIKRVEVKDPKSTFAIEYANTEFDATWGTDSTVNTRGGSKPIYLKSDYAPLVAPEIQFLTNVTNVTESNVTVKLSVRRRYGNNDSSRAEFFVVSGNATAGADYTINTSKILRFKPYGDQIDSTTITVNILDDAFSDPNENVAVRLTNPYNSVIGIQSTNTVNIIDNDIPTISFDKSTITVSETAGFVKLKVKMKTCPPNATDVKLYVKYKSDSTLVPTEFKLGSNNKDTTFTFAGGIRPSDSIDLKLNIINDNLAEDRNDTIIFVLRSATFPAVFSKDSLFTLVITDDDAPPVFSFSRKTISVKENVGSVKVRVNLTGRNYNQSDIAVKFIAGASSATESKDLTFNPTTKIYSVLTTDPDSIVLTVPILNDNLHESTETGLFILTPFLNAKAGKPDTLRLFILDDDIVEYPINKVTTYKVATGIADSINTKCKLRGLVYGVNLQPTGTPNGFLFTLIDGTGGIQVINSTGNKGYTVAEGDSIYVIGTIGQAGGMVQLQSIDSLIKLASGRTLKKTTVVNTFDESTESKLIRLNVVKLANPSQWPSNSMAANTVAKVKLVNQTDSFTLYIDSETDIDGTPAPIGFINVIGLGGQSDATSPFTSNYHIAPRRLSDILIITSPTFSFTTLTTNTPENRDSTNGFVLIGTNLTGPEQISAVIKGGSATRNVDYQSASTTRTFNLTPSQPSVIIKVKLIDDAITEQPETIEWVIRGNQYGTLIGADSLHRDTLIDDESVGIAISRLATETILFPNPTKNNLNITTTALIQNITVYDISGRIVYEATDINAFETKLNTENFAKGIYNISIVTDRGIITKSFSKVE
ncbi:MAG: Calx-beta domain-containing protein [bacterium]|nr:Calx-beta domain-containing protein [bacterium]